MTDSAATGLAGMTIFDTTAIPIHVIRLGYLAELDGGWNVTLDTPGGARRGYGLTQEHYDLLASIDPTVTDRPFTTREQAMLLTLAREKAVMFVSDLDAADRLTMVPVLRRALFTTEIVEAGYWMRVGDESDDSALFLSEAGARIALLMDGRRTLGEIVERVHREALADLANAGAIARMRQRGISPHQHLMAEALSFIKALGAAGAATFEPAVVRPRD